MATFAIALALATLFLFGGWVIMADLATRSLSPVNAVFLSYVSSLGIVGAYVFASRRPIVGTNTDVVFALASGLFLAIGTISFYGALTRGNVAVVSAIAALYFVVPVLFGVFYFETPLSTTNVVGIGLAVVAVVLIAS